MEKYTKLNDKEVQIEITKVETKVINLDELNYERDSLVRTQEANTAFAISENAKIDTLIAEVDAKIAQLKSIGAKTDAEIVSAQPALEVM